MAVRRETRRTSGDIDDISPSHSLARRSLRTSRKPNPLWTSGQLAGAVSRGNGGVGARQEDDTEGRRDDGRRVEQPAEQGGRRTRPGGSSLGTGTARHGPTTSRTPRRSPPRTLSSTPRSGGVSAAALRGASIVYNQGRAGERAWDLRLGRANDIEEHALAGPVPPATWQELRPKGHIRLARRAGASRAFRERIGTSARVRTRGC